MKYGQITNVLSSSRGGWGSVTHHPVCYQQLSVEMVYALATPFNQTVELEQKTSMKLIRLENTNPAIHTQVSDEDYEWLARYKWRLQLGYAVRTTFVDRYITPENMGMGDRSDKPGRADRVQSIQMGREILKTGMGMDMKRLVCDHIDRDRLNNQRCNLRPATTAQNRVNSERDRDGTSKYKGVFLQNGKWVANGYSGGKRKYLGTFKLEEDAARAYNAFVKVAHGEFAKLNDVPDAPTTEVVSYRGVSRSRNGKRWTASGVWNGRRRYFGTFATAQMAAAAYDRFAKTRVSE